MSITFLEILSAQRILPPSGLWGWLLWMLLLGLTAFLAWRWGGHKNIWKRNDWGWLLLLGLLSPLSILIFTIRLPAESALPIPEIGAPALGPLLPPLAALPWMFAALRFGPLPGALLGAFSGLLFSLWDTRSPFTPLEFGFLGACFGALLLQSYRTRFFAWLRQPVGAALVLVILYPFLYLLTVFFWTGDNPLSSIDFALSRVTWVSVAATIQIFLGAAILQYLRARKPELNPSTELRRPAPSERSLEAHFLFTLGPIVLLAFLILGALGWWIAGRSAEQLLGERIASSTHIAADSVPFLLETGQNLILQLARDTRLADPSPPDALGILQNHLDSVPYFEQLILVDTGGNTIASYPVANVADLQPGQEELSAVALAIQGVSLQFFSIPPLAEQSSAAQLSFVATVRNSNGQVRSVLIGRTSLSSNPFAQPILQSLQSINAFGGQAYLLDGDGRFVIAPLPSALLQSYNGRVADNALSYEDVGPDGARRLVRYEPVTGST